MITSRRIVAFLILGVFFFCFIFFVVAPSLKEWDKFVNVTAIFISRKGLEHMSQEDKDILAQKKNTYPRIMNFADGSILYLK